jgi:anti-sigma factor RsiW
LNCDGVIHEISNYIDGELTAAIKQELENHLAECKECTLVVHQTRLTVELFCDCEVVELPADVRSRLHDALQRKIRGTANPEA